MADRSRVVAVLKWANGAADVGNLDAMRACDTCGTTAPAGSAFCGQCGARLSQSPPPSLAPQTMAALRRNERKVVTILFADITGSLALVAGRDPELAGEILATVVACMTEAVRRHGGLVNQVMGDGIMALFGAPIAIEDHAAQACLAALSMRLAIQDQVRPAVSLRVGLGTGEVVVRAVPGDISLHYSAAGEAVHLASRMEQSAAPGQILLTDHTRILAGAVIEVAARTEIAVKGVDAPMTVYELLGTRQGAAPPPQRQAHRIIGREHELDILRNARDRAFAGQGHAIRLIGEAGSGKSRLLREFTGAHLPAAWQLCHAEAVPHRRTSYGVVTDLLSALFGLQPGDTPQQRQDKIASSLALPNADRDAAFAPLSALLDLQTIAPNWHALDAWERRERTIAATVQAFHSVSRRRPLAVVVEDAHWLDAESAASIQRLGATARDRPLLAIVSLRAGQGPTSGPAYDAAWRDARWEDCPVRPLDEAATRAFLRARLLPGHDVPDLERKLIEHTRGNPLFLEECLQALIEKGALVRAGDMARLDHPVASLEVPANLRGLLDARVDRLPDADKDVLQAAAVVGSTVPMDLLASAAGLHGAALHAVVDRLVQAALLAEPGPSAVAFRHGLIREAAYNAILKRRRVRMHGDVLDALERRPGPDEPIVDLLADHAIHAEVWPKAVAYARRAAVRAYERYANPEAVQFYDRALLAAAALPPGPERDETLAKLHIGVRFPLFRLGRVQALGPHLDEAVRLAAAKPGHEELAQAHIMRSHVHWLGGNAPRALDDAAAAAALGHQHDDAELTVRAGFQRGLIGLSQSDVPATLAGMGAVIAHLGPRPAPGRYGLDDRLLVNAHAYAARAHAAAGALDAARHAVNAALDLANTIGERQTRIYAHLADSIVSLAEGRAARAVAAASEANELCRGADVRLLGPVAAQCLAQAHVAAGDPATALPIARLAVEEAARMGFLAMQPQRLLILAETLAALGCGPEAETEALAARAMASTSGEAGTEAASLLLLAQAAARAGRPAEAAGLLAEARAIASRLGLHPLLRRHAADAL